MTLSPRAWCAFAICGLAATIASCNRQPQRAVERLAILAFENQTPDASAVWIGRAVALIAAAQTAGNDRVQTFAAADIREAHTNLATRTIEGYLTSDNGRTALKATLRDEPTGRVLSTFTLEGGDVLAIAKGVAAQTGAPVSSYTTSNQSAIRAYMEATGASDAATAEAKLREAVRLDPQYGAPYVALHNLLTRTGRAQEAQTLMAGASSLRLTGLERARLRATSVHTPTERADALIELARLQPGDTVSLKQAAETAMNIRQYDKALVALDELLRRTPNDEAALNMRGYTQLHRGDFETARAAFEDYRRRAPQSANAIDSLGELMFYHRKYDESAKLFLEAHTKQPAMLQGAEPFRAAYAHFLAGNVAEADRVFAIWVPDSKDIRFAIWRRWTGRPSGDTPPALAALWALQDGNREAAAQFAISARQPTATPATAGFASVVLLLAQPSASAEVWNARLQQALPAPQQENIRTQLLGWALVLDKRWPEAVAHWRAAFEKASGQFNNEQRILLATSLLGAGQTSEARKIMPHGFLPPSALGAGLDLLLYPMAVETSRKLRS